MNPKTVIVVYDECFIDDRLDLGKPGEIGERIGALTPPADQRVMRQTKRQLEELVSAARHQKWLSEVDPAHAGTELTQSALAVIYAAEAAAERAGWTPLQTGYDKEMI